MQSSPSHGMRLRLKSRVSAVKLDPEVERTVNIKGIAVQIPAGEVVEVDGDMRLGGLRYVVWGRPNFTRCSNKICSPILNRSEYGMKFGSTL